MGHQRAPSSGITLSEDDAAIVKGMLNRGDRQHDIAAWFGVNGGRIGEIAAGTRYNYVQPADEKDLPPPGPYLSGKENEILIQALHQARQALDQAENLLRRGH